MASWFDQVKNAKIKPLAADLGIEFSRDGKKFRPCLSCGATQRSDDDRRSPVGTSATGAGWHCHACDTSGDVIDLVALRVAGRRMAEAKGSAADVRAWFAERNMVSAGGSTPDGRRTTRVRHAVVSQRAPKPISAAKENMIDDDDDEPVKKPAENKLDDDDDGLTMEAAPKPGAVAAGKLFDWKSISWEACHAALMARETPEARAVYDYMVERRKLTEQAIIWFGFGVYVDASGKPVLTEGRPWLTIPLRDEHAAVVNVRFRSVPMAGTCVCDGTGCKKCKTYRVCSKRPLPLFGSESLADVNEAGPVIIVEGELDVASAYVHGFTAGVVSSTAGATGWTDAWYDLIEPFQDIVGMMEHDPKGDEAWVDITEKLGSHRCRRGTVPGEVKDWNDALIAGVSAERMAKAIDDAKSSLAVRVVKPSDIGVDFEARLAQDPNALRGIQTRSKSLNKLMGGLRPGLIIVSGETAHGKTTWLTWLLWSLAADGHDVLITSYEQKPIGSYQKLLRLQLGDDFSNTSPAQRRAAEVELDKHVHMLKHAGNTGFDEMLSSIEYAKRRHNVKAVLIDHLGFVTDQDAEDERREIERVVRKLAVWSSELDLIIFLVAHPGNTQPKSNGKYERPTLKSLKGASAIRQDADDVLIVERVDPDFNPVTRKGVPYPRTTIHGDKIRSEFGMNGGSVTMAFDPVSTMYADTWEETPGYARIAVVPAGNSLLDDD